MKQKRQSVNIRFYELGDRVVDGGSSQCPSNMSSSNSNIILLSQLFSASVFISWPQKRIFRNGNASALTNQSQTTTANCDVCRVCRVCGVCTLLFMHQNKLSATGIYAIVCFSVFCPGCRWTPQTSCKARNSSKKSCAKREFHLHFKIYILPMHIKMSCPFRVDSATVPPWNPKPANGIL